MVLPQSVAARWHSSCRSQHSPRRRRLLQALGALENLSDTDKPRLVIAHLMSPHPPLVLDGEGHAVVSNSALSLPDGHWFAGDQVDNVEGYRQQATFVLTRLDQLVSGFVSQSAKRQREALVIIHGDHGPRAALLAPPDQGPDPREMFAVFLGVRSAGQANDLPTSLVNVYRRIASLYLGASLPDLPNHAYGAAFESPMCSCPSTILSGPIKQD